MKARWLFLILAIILAGCELTLSYYVSVTEVEYTSKGVCSGVELTTNNPKITGIGYMYSTEGRDDSVRLTPGQPMRIPDPNPEPRRTKYMLGFDGPVLKSAEVDLTWRCLPDKQPLRVQFTYYVGQSLRITENPASAHGFDIEVVDF